MTKTAEQIYTEGIANITSLLKGFDPNISKLSQILQGVAPKIFNVGIIDIENPFGISVSVEEIKRRRDAFVKECKHSLYTHYLLNGELLGMMNPILVQNIDIESLVKLAGAYNQKAFLYGINKIQEGERHIELQRWEINQDAKPYKYELFDDTLKIPLDSQDFEKVTWDRNRISLLEDEVNLLPTDIRKIIGQQNERIHSSLFSDKTGHSKYYARGFANSFFNTLLKSIESR